MVMLRRRAICRVDQEHMLNYMQLLDRIKTMLASRDIINNIKGTASLLLEFCIPDLR